MGLTTLRAFFLKVDTFKIFAESDAWLLFKWTAISEVFGWTLLIYGIIAEKLHIFASRVALPVGGSIHGVLFIAYLIVVVATYSSLGWTRGRAIFGILISAIPYGTLAFELWVANKRHALQLQSYRKVLVRGVIRDGAQVLAIQPVNAAEWQLPSGEVLLHETSVEALHRIVFAITGITPKIGVRTVLTETARTIEFTYLIENVASYRSLDLYALAKDYDLIDEMKFVTVNTESITTEIIEVFS